MFCTKCGSQMPDNSPFCSSCGASIQNGQPIVNQNMGTQNMGQPNMNQPFTGQPYQGQSFSGQPNMVNPNTAYRPMGMAKPKNNTPLFVGIGAAAVIGLVVIFFIFKGVLGGGTNSSAEGVVKTFFKAIDTQDTTLLKKTVYAEDEDIMEGIDELSKGMLTLLDEQLEQELGDNWFKKLSYDEKGTKKEDGKTYVEVEVIAEGEEDDPLTVTVVKDDGKYYIIDMPF